MTKSVIVIDTNDGWDGVYIDNKYVWSGDSLSPSLLIRLLEEHAFMPKDFILFKSANDKLDAQICEFGEFPKELTDDIKSQLI